MTTVDLNNTNKFTAPNFQLNRQMRPSNDYDANLLTELNNNNNLILNLNKEFQEISLNGTNNNNNNNNNNADSYNNYMKSCNKSCDDIYEQDDYIGTLTHDYASKVLHNSTTSSGYGTSMSSSDSVSNSLNLGTYETNSSFNDSVFSTPSTPTTPNIANLALEYGQKAKTIHKSPSGFGISNNMQDTSNSQPQQQQQNLNENLKKIQLNLEGFLNNNNPITNNAQRQQTVTNTSTNSSNSSPYMTSSNSFPPEYSPFTDYTGLNSLNKNFTSMNNGIYNATKKNMFDTNVDNGFNANNLNMSNEALFNHFYQSVLSNDAQLNDKCLNANLLNTLSSNSNGINDILAQKQRLNSLSKACSLQQNSGSPTPSNSQQSMKNSQYLLQQSAQQKQLAAAAAAAAAANVSNSTNMSSILNRPMNTYAPLPLNTNLFSNASSYLSHNDNDYMSFPNSAKNLIQQQQQQALTSSGKPLRSERLPSQLVDELVKQAKIRRRNGGKKEVCVFCRNNGEKEQIYTSHTLKDANNRVNCPILRLYQCPICQASGDNAHTIKYCPYAEKDAGMKLFKDGRMNTATLLMNSNFSMSPPPMSPTETSTSNGTTTSNMQNNFPLSFAQQWNNLLNASSNNNQNKVNPALLSVLQAALNGSQKY